MVRAPAFSAKRWERYSWTRTSGERRRDLRSEQPPQVGAALFDHCQRFGRVVYGVVALEIIQGRRNRAHPELGLFHRHARESTLKPFPQVIFVGFRAGLAGAIARAAVALAVKNEVVIVGLALQRLARISIFVFAAVNHKRQHSNPPHVLICWAV